MYYVYLNSIVATVFDEYSAKEPLHSTYYNLSMVAVLKNSFQSNNNFTFFYKLTSTNNKCQYFLCIYVTIFVKQKIIGHVDFSLLISAQILIRINVYKFSNLWFYLSTSLVIILYFIDFKVLTATRYFILEMYFASLIILTLTMTNE